MSSTEDVEKLLEVPGFGIVTSKKPGDYLAAIQKATEKVEMQQTSNSSNLNMAKDEMEEEEKTMKKRMQVVKHHEMKLSGAKATVAASERSIERIKVDKIQTLEREAVLLVQEENKLKGANVSVNGVEATAKKDRFFGENGMGDATVMRKVTDYHSVGDLAEVSCQKKRGILSCVAWLGAETKEYWLQYWDTAPDGMSQEEWRKNAGVKRGVILTHNDMKEQQVDFIITHLFKLSPVETPSPKYKRKRESFENRGRSASRSTSRARSRSRSSKKARLEELDKARSELEAFTKKLVSNMEAAIDDSDSEEESEGEL